MSLLAFALLTIPIEPASGHERQLTTDALQKNLDNNLNFSPDGNQLVFDCRGETGINGNDLLGVVDVRTGAYRILYRQIPPDLGLGAASFLNSREVIAIHCLPNGVTYDSTERGGMIVPVDGLHTRWLDSRDVTLPFTPGALRGGTHAHEPDATGKWIGFTYNDHIMRGRGSDLRNVGVSKRGMRVVVDTDGLDNRNVIGESFSVLLTACVDRPKPGADEYQRADADCWIGREGYPLPGGRHQRARAFRGAVVVDEGGMPVSYGDIFVVDVPDDITVPGPLGPLQGTITDYPKPPKGATIRRLTHTAEAPDRELRGTLGLLRASGDGRWICYIGRVREGGTIAGQIFVVSAATGAIRQLSRVPGGVMGDPRFSDDSGFVAVAAPDGSVWRVSARTGSWGKAKRIAQPNPNAASLSRDISGLQTRSLQP